MQQKKYWSTLVEGVPKLLCCLKYKYFKDLLYYPSILHQTLSNCATVPVSLDAVTDVTTWWLWLWCQRRRRCEVRGQVVVVGIKQKTRRRGEGLWLEGGVTKGLLFGVDMQMRLSRSWFSAWTLRCLCQRCCCLPLLLLLLPPPVPRPSVFMDAVVNRKWATRGRPSWPNHNGPAVHKTEDGMFLLM